MTPQDSDMCVVVAEDERSFEETTPIDGAMCVALAVDVTSLEG